MSDSERDRIRQLREKQLRDRDPGQEVKVDWKGAKPKKQMPLHEALFGALPRNVQGGLIGLLIGIVLMIIVQYLIANVWQLPAEYTLLGIVALLLPIPVGIIIGRATDHGGYMD